MSAIPSPKHVFMSYSRRDDTVMRRVLDDLRKQGINVWLDNEKLIPGTPIWEREIERAIKNAAAIIVICSPDSNESEWVRREITFAERYRKRIFPVLVRGNEDTSISIRLSTRQYVDLRKNEERGLQSLSAAVAFHLEELERQESEERKKAERREQEERPRLAAEQKPQKEREEQERKEAAEIRRESPSPSGRKVRGEGKSAWLPFGLGGVAILTLVCLIFGGIYLVQNWAPIKFAATPLPTNMPPANPKIGSTWVQSIDNMPMVYVTTGEFEMGSEDGGDNEKPVHTVYLDAFWIDQTEVTNTMYARCVEAGACDSPSSTKSHTHNSYYGNPEFDSYPVIYVSWNDAVAYCEWAERRLPTEAEWEKAASWNEEKQTKYVYPWGDSIDCSQANYSGNDGVCVGDTTAVGSYESGKSPYGAYDMAGNISEWVGDWHDHNYYSNSPSSNPTGPDSGFARALRGGSWSSGLILVRSALRVGVGPATSIDNVGFRCSRDVTP